MTKDEIERWAIAYERNMEPVEIDSIGNKRYSGVDVQQAYIDGATVKLDDLEWKQKLANAKIECLESENKKLSEYINFINKLDFDGFVERFYEVCKFIAVLCGTTILVVFTVCGIQLLLK